MCRWREREFLLYPNWNILSENWREATERTEKLLIFIKCSGTQMKWQWANLSRSSTLIFASHIRRAKVQTHFNMCSTSRRFLNYRISSIWSLRLLHVLIFCHTYFKVKSAGLKTLCPQNCKNEFIIKFFLFLREHILV